MTTVFYCDRRGLTCFFIKWNETTRETSWPVHLGILDWVCEHVIKSVSLNLPHSFQIKATISPQEGSPLCDHDVFFYCIYFCYPWVCLHPPNRLIRLHTRYFTLIVQNLASPISLFSVLADNTSTWPFRYIHYYGWIQNSPGFNSVITLTWDDRIPKLVEGR